jgi:hypothetical protein
MAEIHGNQGSIFYRSGYIAATTIAFVDSNPDTITDSGNGFVDAGFVAGDTIAVTGSTDNNDEYTIDTGGVAVGTLTLIGGDSLTVEGAGDPVIIQTVPGTELGGFFNWSLNWTGEVHDTTAFSDGSARTFTSGLTGWTVSAEKWWLTGAGTANQGPAVGDSVVLRLFVIYTATPAVTTNYYYEGSAIVTAHNPTTPVDGIVKGTLTFQGSDTLTFVTRNTAWG